MHEVWPYSASARQAAAIAAVDEYLAGLNAAHGRLPASTLTRYCGRRYLVGWWVRVRLDEGTEFELKILADGGFPYTPAKIAVTGAPAVLTWPHLERDGHLCVLPSGAAVASEAPVLALQEMLGTAIRLIKDSVSGRNTEDFRQEFLSYWTLAIDVGAVRYLSLLEPRGPSRRVSVWRGQYVRVAGECDQAVRQWLLRCGGAPSHLMRAGALIWLPEPLLPVEYPRTTADVAALARERSPAAVEIMESVAAEERSGFDVLIGASTSNGACLAAVTIPPPPPRGGPRRSREMLTAGFRPGQVPRRLYAARYLSAATKVTKANAERADHQWIHGRDQDPQQAHLRRQRVAVLGCGSLGGALARLLAQSGVGNLLLNDPETLDWPNLSRHELGARSVHRGKAPELAREIERAYPHLGQITARRDRVGPEARDLLDDLLSCDLIISTMGDWAAEGFLNEFQRETHRCPSIIYGWVEPHASAAHALLVTTGEAGCLKCGTNATGRPHMTVTEWPAGTSRQAPACGAQFTPYGPTELAWAHALMLEAGIDALLGQTFAETHRIWIAPRSRIEMAGGAWSSACAEGGITPGAGGITVRRRWPANPSCPVCGCQARVA